MGFILARVIIRVGLILMLSPRMDMIGSCFKYVISKTE